MDSPVNISILFTIDLAFNSTFSFSSSSNSDMNGIVSFKITKYLSLIFSKRWSITSRIASLVYQSSERVFISNAMFIFYHMLSSWVRSSISNIKGFKFWLTNFSKSGILISSNRFAIGSHKTSNESFYKKLDESYL